MPRDPSWDEIHANFSKQSCFPGCYHAWLNKHGFNDEKPRAAQMETVFEAFSWMGDTDPTAMAGTPNKVRFFANHVGCTLNKNCRSSEELRLSARSLALRPILINHGMGNWKGKELAGWTADSEFDFDERANAHGVAGWGFLSDRELWEKVRKREAPFSKGAVSIGEVARKTVSAAGAKDVVGGKFFELSLLTDDFEPGDPKGYVEVIETLIPVLETIREMKMSDSTSSDGKPLDEKSVTEFLTNYRAQLVETVWSTDYINNLPDSAFAYIESGGTKDSEGKTTPRFLRHLPHHDESGKIDLSHLANADVQAKRTKVESVIAHVEAEKKALKVGEYADSKEFKEAWSRIVAEAFKFGSLEERLYKMEMLQRELDARTSVAVKELLNKEVAKHELGRFLEIFGPQIGVMRAEIAMLKEDAKGMKEGGKAANTGIPPPSESAAREFRQKFEALFVTPIHVEHLPPHVGRNYLRDAILSDRAKLKSQLENLK